MEFRLKIKYSTEDKSWLCFRHAVEVAVKGEDVEVDIDDYGSDYYGGTTSCVLCYPHDWQ